MKQYQPIIGLEVHIELATNSKMFCGCPADHFGKEPNTQTCPVCLGLPGALPVPNKKAIAWTILLGLALNSQINKVSSFDRKNYFYPDLPKGYQISQHFQPFCTGGQFDNIRLNNIHLEEDTGKLQHKDGETLIDFNRSGVPLVEIVTEPDFRSVEEVDKFLKKLQRIIRYLGISTADMEKGSMRLEPSISIKPISNNQLQFPIPNNQLPNYRVELKNINSFRFVRSALEFEIQRQQKEPHIQQTRGWDENKKQTFAQRDKEEAHDYRYFPEPDIPPIDTSGLQPILPELPDAKKSRFIDQYSLSTYQADILTESPQIANNFEKSVQENKNFTPLDIANSIINKRPLEKNQIGDITDDQLNQIIQENQRALVDFKAGKTQVFDFLIGQAIKLAPGADRNKIKEKLYEKIS